jgi:hypothetical protein
MYFNLILMLLEWLSVYFTHHKAEMAGDVADQSAIFFGQEGFFNLIIVHVGKRFDSLFGEEIFGLTTLG